MKIVTHIIVLANFLFLTNLVLSQNTHNTRVFGGYGNYENTFAGISWQYQKRNHLSLALCTNYMLIADKSLYATFIKNQLGFNFKKDSTTQHFKWQFGVSVMYWRLEDMYYIWNVMSFIPSFERNIRINSRLNLVMGVGASIQLVLHSERKTFDEVGWPYKLRPNAFVQLTYLL